eukprot:TRINITY_DN10070_c0_g1_i1.p2 TRINITY_DN10070_c0_g1~~TRINITY_DN10070_c0_g1_i1.p2  ORF type:complete len:238 (+),score=105.54 TRINITY_DN10070_c0_g1_i1:88-714(+)
MAGGAALRPTGPLLRGALAATNPVLQPAGGPWRTTRRPGNLKPKKWSAIGLQQEGPVMKDPLSITERGWVLKMIYLKQPVTKHDLWEEVFISPFNPIYNKSHLTTIIKHLRKDLMVYVRLDPDDLQFYIYMYPQWARLVRNFIDAERRTEQQEDAKRMENPLPPYDPEPIRYYHDYLEEQERRARLRLEQLRASQQLMHAQEGEAATN